VSGELLDKWTIQAGQSLANPLFHSEVPRRQPKLSRSTAAESTWKRRRADTPQLKARATACSREAMDAHALARAHMP
jgi:hypothetical protein